MIITDSQVFPSVWKAKPAESLLTSFSILFAGYKGDIQTFLHGAKAIASLTENSTVLIAEACAHAPTTEDIGREKIPRLLRQRVGQGLSFTFLRGNDFPQDLSPYDLRPGQPHLNSPKHNTPSDFSDGVLCKNQAASLKPTIPI